MADSNEETVIGADSHFNGELRFEKTARIIGKFDGNIVGKGELNVTQTAVCKASVEAANANIDGTVEGNVTATDTVKLNAHGVVRGDIVAAKMVMAEGASFSGRCEVGGSGKSSTASGGSGGSPSGSGADANRGAPGGGGSGGGGGNPQNAGNKK
jgi:cytoskeletal protein CcmA (bactofilin family)